MTPNLYASVLSDEHQSILWKVQSHFWKWKLCCIQAPLLAGIEAGDIRLAAQHSPAVRNHYRDVLITAYLGDDFTLFCFSVLYHQMRTQLLKGEHGY